MKPGATHTSFPRGKRVHVILRDGSSFVARFDQTDKKRRQMRFLDHEAVSLRRLRSASIQKGEA